MSPYDDYDPDDDYEFKCPDCRQKFWDNNLGSNCPECEERICNECFKVHICDD